MVFSCRCVVQMISWIFHWETGLVLVVYITMVGQADRISFTTLFHPRSMVHRCQPVGLRILTSPWNSNIATTFQLTALLLRKPLAGRIDHAVGASGQRKVLGKLGYDGSRCYEVGRAHDICDFHLAYTIWGQIPKIPIETPIDAQTNRGNGEEIHERRYLGATKSRERFDSNLLKNWFRFEVSKPQTPRISELITWPWTGVFASENG